MNVFVLVSCAIVLLALSSDAYFLGLTKPDLVDTMYCVSESKNKALCNQLVNCQRKMPAPVVKSFAKCYTKFKLDKDHCVANEKIYPSEDVISKILDCIVDDFPSGMSEEDMTQVRDYEYCIIALNKAAHCPPIPE